jgi:hypothetical protein
MQGEAISPVTARVLDLDNPLGSAAKADYINSTTAWFAMETVIRETLGGAGAPLIQYPFYLSFGREMWALHAMRGINLAGYTGQMELVLAKAKWVARGLDGAILDAVAAQFVLVMPPGAPTPTLPSNGGVVETSQPTLTVTSVPSATDYDFRVFYQEVLVVEKANSATPAWEVAPPLVDERTYAWDCRVRIGGVWGPRFYPRWTFAVSIPT